MNYKQHRNYGITTALSVSIGYYFLFAGGVIFHEPLFWYSIMLFVATFLGSQFPDLDTNSIPAKIVSMVLMVLWGAVLFIEYYSENFSIDYSIKWQPLAIGTFSFLVCSSSKHRSFTHAILWTPILFIVAYNTGIYLIGGFALGHAAHLYCDKVNPLVLKNWWFNPLKVSFWF